MKKTAEQMLEELDQDIKSMKLSDFTILDLDE